MKKTLLSSAILGLALLAQNASATFLDYDDFRDWDVVRQSLNNGPLTGTLSIASEDSDSLLFDKWGFNPSLHTVTNAAIGFSFYTLDALNAKVWGSFSIEIGSMLDLNVPVEISSGEPDGVGPFGYVVDTATLGGLLRLSILTDIQEDGMIDWRVSLAEGESREVFLGGAGLGVEVAAKTVPDPIWSEARPVPDSGATAAILGFAVLGAVVVRRRLGQ